MTAELLFSLGDDPREPPRVFREWQKHLTAHLAGLDTFGKGYEQRKVVYDAYIKYCRELPNDGSELARERKRVIREAGDDELD